MCLVGIILGALAVGLGGLFLLAKSQKENLGKLYSVSSYVVITISALIILFSITAAVIHHCHKKHGCGEGKCGSEQSCHDKKDGCKKMKGCSSDGTCGASMSDCSGSSCSKSKMKCSKGKMSCGKGGDCMMMMNHHGGKMMEKKIIKTIDGDSAEVKVNVMTH